MDQQPRAEWEAFDSPKPNHHRIVVDLIQAEGYGNVEIPTSTKDVDAQKETAERERIFSMFEASCPDTGDIGAALRPMTLGSKRRRPTTAVPLVPVEPESANGSVLTAIFSIDKTSYDVHMYDDKITWSPVSQVDTRKPPSRYEDLKHLPVVQRGMVHIHEISSVRLKSIRNTKAKTVTTIGFAIFTTLQRGGKLREHLTLFICYSREICVKWATRIKSILAARSERPKRVLVLSTQSFAEQDIWDDVVQERLQTVGITGKLMDIPKSKTVSESLQNVLAEQAISQDAGSYDGILALGKTAFFSEVLQTVHQFKSQALKTNTWHPNIPTIGLIPVSSSSYVGKELHGCADAETAVFHAIYGCKQSVPVCSFYDKDGNFLRHGLTASYGFSGGDTAGSATTKGVIQGTIRKGLAITRAIVQRRLYPCEICFKDSPQNYEPYNDDEIFAEEEFSRFSIVNHHYINDDAVVNGNHSYDALEGDDSSCDNAVGNGNYVLSRAGNGTDVLATDHALSNGDFGVWPQLNNWDVVPRRNYLDVMVTSLPQRGGDSPEHECPLSAILVRETMSRKELLRGMGSQVSLSSNAGKSKPEILDKTDILKGSEFIIKPCGQQGTSSASSVSQWTIDDVCLDPEIQELHVKVSDYSMLMYARAPDQPLSVPASPDILKLLSDDVEVTLDSMA